MPNPCLRNQGAGVVGSQGGGVFFPHMWTALHGKHYFGASNDLVMTGVTPFVQRRHALALFRQRPDERRQRSASSTQERHHDRPKIDHEKVVPAFLPRGSGTFCNTSQLHHRLSIGEPSSINDYNLFKRFCDFTKLPWQRDRSFSFGRLALTHRQSGDKAKALNYLRQGQEIMARLTKLSPDNAVWKDDLSWFEGQIKELGP